MVGLGDLPPNTALILTASVAAAPALIAAVASVQNNRRASRIQRTVDTGNGKDIGPTVKDTARAIVELQQSVDGLTQALDRHLADATADHAAFTAHLEATAPIVDWAKHEMERGDETGHGSD